MSSSLAMKLERDLRGDDDDGDGGHRAIDERDVLDRLAAMLRQEEHYLCHDYLLDVQAANAAAGGSRAGEAIDETCRSKMCEWIYHVIDSTRLQRETAGVAMDYLDRFLCTSSLRAAACRSNRKEYQLAAMTCLYIAVKMREPFEMDAGLMSRLSRGVHSAEEITSLERDVLIALQWRVNGPTPVQFVNHILELLPESARRAAPTLLEHSHFQAELAVGDYAYVPHLRRSTVAVASILNSLGGIERGGLPFVECVRTMRRVSSALGVDVHSPLVHAVRGRLLESFAKSSGYELCREVVPIPTMMQEEAPPKAAEAYEESPTCVSKGSVDYVIE